MGDHLWLVIKSQPFAHFKASDKTNIAQTTAKLFARFHGWMDGDDCKTMLGQQRCNTACYAMFGRRSRSTRISTKQQHHKVTDAATGEGMLIAQFLGGPLSRSTAKK